MQVIKDISGMQAISDARTNGIRIGFVPTMGALHTGHLELMKRSVAECDYTVVSIFVNPAQFGKNEDLSRYPRDLDKDLELMRPLGVDYVFFPTEEMMYPDGYKTWVELSEISDVLCGASRPGHFRGVATVVLKLVNIVRPDFMYMGEKDFQQVVVLETMLRDLNLKTQIVRCPIVRDENGLALSSRNEYLSKDEYIRALGLNRSIKITRDMAKTGERSVLAICSLISQHLLECNARIDYVKIVDSNSLTEQVEVNDQSRLLLAVWIGKTRLIDNARVLLDN